MMLHKNSIIGIYIINVFSAVKDKSLSDDIPVRDGEVFRTDDNGEFFDNIGLWEREKGDWFIICELMKYGFEKEPCWLLFMITDIIALIGCWTSNGGIDIGIF